MNKQQKKRTANIAPLPWPKSLENEDKNLLGIGMQNLNLKKTTYNLSFSPKNKMYVILGTLLLSLVSTSTVKTRKV